MTIPLGAAIQEPLTRISYTKGVTRAYKSKNPPPSTPTESNVLRIKLESAQHARMLEITVPPSWQSRTVGLFLTFNSPGGWILELVPVLRLIHPQQQLRIELLERPFEEFEHHDLEDLRWIWILGAPFLNATED